MQHNDFQQKNTENAALQGLFAGEKAPPHLSSKIIEAMKNESLISLPKPLISTSVPGMLSAFLLAVLFASAGFLFGHSQANPGTAPAPLPGANQKQFALLVKADDVPPADPEQQFREYSAWVEGLKKERWAGGEALHGNAWRLRTGTNGQLETLTHTLKSSPDELSGYFLFEAKDENEALRIAATCPHLKYSGTLELREIFK